jgi:hypothetical protein
MVQRTSKHPPRLLVGSFPWWKSNHDEERLARVERMLEQCRRESAALKVIAASKVVEVVVNALGATPAIKPTTPKRKD